MDILINTSNWGKDLDRFGKKSEELDFFLREKKLTGIELIQCYDLDESRINKNIIKGLHLRYYPICLEMFRNDNEKLKDLFVTEENIKYFYGGSRDYIVESYRKELKFAKDIGVKYVVFHVSHVLLEDCFTYKYEYTDEEVIETTIEFLNEVLEGFKGDFYFLFENLWWPGLTFLNNNLTEKLLKNVNYNKKGFMLDTGHLINTNMYIKNEEEAIEYIIEKVKDMGYLKKYIKGIHLNLSLSGEYVERIIKEPQRFSKAKNLEEFKKQFADTYAHIFKIDNHKAFSSKSIQKLFKYVDPEFLVYEFIANEKQQLEEYILKQHNALDF